MVHSRVKVGPGGSARSHAQAFRAFRLLEVQETFRRPPSRRTVARWRRRAPPGFEFTARAWRLITHRPSDPAYGSAGTPIPEGERSRYGDFRPTAEVFRAWERTREACEGLGATVVVFETPESFGPLAENRDNLYAFFGGIRAPFALAWEPRGPWPLHVVERICEDLGLQHATDPFAQELADQPRAYYRLRGRPAAPRGAPAFTDEELARLRGFCEDVDEAYVVFNTPAAIDDARRFLDLIPQRW